MDVTKISQTLFGFVDAALQSALVTGMAKVMLGLGALFGTMWLIHFTLRNMQWLYRGMNVAFEDVAKEIAKMAFIAGCAFNLQWYVQTIVPFITGFPNWMGGILSGQEGTQTNQIDSLIVVYVSNLKALIGAMNFDIFNASFTNIWLGIQGVVFYVLGGIPFLLAAVATLYVLKVLSTAIVAVGLLFIAFLLFDQTKQYFWGWVAAIAGFMLAQILISVVLAIEIGFINTVMIKNGVMDTSLEGNLTILIVFCTFTALVIELPGQAASIMGGGPSGGGIVSRISGFSAAKGMTRGVAAGISRLRRGRNNIK
ncbi:type IV secretion system protein [Pseudomonas syringae]|uniref:VirB6 n=1 Tax=Pseudomonas syringae pv. syringae TaxID=321 RepID=A0A1S6YBE1_PSESY|nr:type IV secretion system protein [Pseudomonas syringae]ALE01080.1 conjugal transfer protein [Pseudomonas syringae UMAF0158]AQX42086.1 VirB6 [Pseudomonas syringae pv. syringae]AQX42151.1 VirB6 [Pseudomonas syringae pv. syringae]MCK9694726.1 type IV secretion system protein [Pseudomonas syringae pv. syringae]MCK9709757.1 type IV secretion system protein [Pseudomonas syringae pv. syringae]